MNPIARLVCLLRKLGIKLDNLRIVASFISSSQPCIWCPHFAMGGRMRGAKMNTGQTLKPKGEVRQEFWRRCDLNLHQRHHASSRRVSWQSWPRFRRGSWLEPHGVWPLRRASSNKRGMKRVMGCLQFPPGGHFFFFGIVSP